MPYYTEDQIIKARSIDLLTYLQTYEPTEEAYSRLEYMAESFRYCNDSFLACRGYRKIMLSRHDYLILYRVVDDKVQISGVFHMMENYARKL